MRGLKDRVVLVTGGARGIGAALCRRFVDEGAKVAIFDVLDKEAGDLARELSANESRARAYGVDIADTTAVRAAVSQVESDLGAIDVLINNAGRNRPGEFVQTDPTHCKK